MQIDETVAVAYLCPPANNKSYKRSIADQWHTCWDFGAENGLRCSFIKEDGDADAGIPVAQRWHLRELLDDIVHGDISHRWNKLIVESPECLSSSPSEFLAILKIFREAHIEVIFVNEPEFFFRPVRLVFSTERMYRSELK